MQSLIAEIRSWMVNNSLLINDSKTEFLIIGTRQQLAKVGVQTIKVGDTEIYHHLPVLKIWVYIWTTTCL